MQDKTNANANVSLYWPACLLAVLVFLIYSNTFNAFWHLDDYGSILNNANIQISDLDFESLQKAIQSPQKDKIWRPVAYLTFALNWYFGGHETAGYHLVNMFIHALTCIFLYVVIIRLLQAPALKGKYGDSRHFLALLATALWAVHPIQTQAVTYIVQRMTLLVGLFYALGIYCYLRIRTDHRASDKVFWSLGLLLSFLLGLGCKENMILLPLSLVLIDQIFFYRPGRKFLDKKTAGVLVGALLAAVAAFFLLDVNIDRVFNGYRNRFFTPDQRLLTECRILIFYLSQLFYPIPSRFSIEHDFELSTSLFSPWTTLPAVIAVLGLIGIGIWQIRKRPLISLAILFFFINHALESTIVPLELVFEHRNYLPSMFVFLPVAAVLLHAIYNYRRRRRWMHALIVGFGALLLVGLGTGTYIRNYDWSSEWSLWMDARKKAPAMSRPLVNLAWTHFEVNGQRHMALITYNHALKKKMHRKSTRAKTLYHMGHIFYRAGNYQKAEEYWRKAIAAGQAKSNYRYYLARAMAGQKMWAAALAELNPLIEDDPANIHYLNLKGNILLYQQKPGPALKLFETCLQIDPQNPLIASNAGVAHLALGANELAEARFKLAAALEPENNRTLMRLIAIHVINQNPEKADFHLHKLLSRVSVTQIQQELLQLSTEPGCEYLQRALGKHLAAVLTDQSRRIESLYPG